MFMMNKVAWLNRQSIVLILMLAVKNNICDARVDHNFLAVVFCTFFLIWSDNDE